MKGCTPPSSTTWKWPPFWTLILIARRLAISSNLYEAASVDGATPWQKSVHVTWPSMQQLYGARVTKQPRGRRAELWGASLRSQ